VYDKVRQVLGGVQAPRPIQGHPLRLLKLSLSLSALTRGDVSRTIRSCLSDCENTWEKSLLNLWGREMSRLASLRRCLLLPATVVGCRTCVAISLGSERDGPCLFLSRSLSTVSVSRQPLWIRFDSFCFLTISSLDLAFFKFRMLGCRFFVFLKAKYHTRSQTKGSNVVLKSDPGHWRRLEQCMSKKGSGD
jgi:hypothetical protein